MENKDDEFKDFKSPWYPFYYNPRDKRILVPKLVGIGLTFNFGHWATWLILALIVALCALLPIAIKWL